jgi:hypothetical protein
LGVSKSTVQRILAQAKLQPHRLERYMASNDPDFETKAADIIGLYLEPPDILKYTLGNLARELYRTRVAIGSLISCDQSFVGSL